LYRFIRLILLIAANDAAFHVVVFQHEAKQFQLKPPSTAPIAKLGVATTARHVITALRSLDINLNNKYITFIHTKRRYSKKDIVTLQKRETERETEKKEQNLN